MIRFVPPIFALVAATTTAVITAVDAWRTLSLVGFSHLDEDVAVYWYAAVEFAHLRFREPFFYGQAYNHLGEALLAAPLVAMGVPLWIGPVLVSTAIGLAPWGALALLAWRRGAVGLAVLFLGAPTLMPVGYTILLGKFFGFGLFAVALAMLAADFARSPGLRLAAGFLAALGVGVVPNAALLAVVAVAWMFVSVPHGDRAGRVRLVVLGLAGGAGVVALGRLFYILRPPWNLHPSPALEFHWTLLVDGMIHLSRHLGRVTPTVFAHPAVPLLAVAGVAIMAARRYRWEAAAPAFSLLAIVPTALAVGKVHEATPSVFFAYERMFLGVPLALGVIALATVGAGLWRGGASARSVIIATAVVVAAGLFKQASLETEVASELRIPQGVLSRVEVVDMRATCDAVERAARATGAGLAVFLVDRTPAYACGALAYGKLTTIFPSYERRTWILQEEAVRPRDALLLVDVDPEAACRRVALLEPGALCGPVGAEMVVVRYRARSAIDFLRSLGVDVRRF